MTRRVLAVLALSALLAPAASAGFARHSNCTSCTDEQRDQFRTTEELVHRLWLQGRRAYQSIRKEGATQERVLGYHEALQTSFAQAWRSHERFVALLDADQKAILQTRLNKAETIRRHGLKRLGELATLASQDAPDRRASAERLEEIADESRDWLRQLRRIDWHASNI